MNKNRTFFAATIAFTIAATLAGGAQAATAEDQQVVDAVKKAIGRNADLRADLLRVRAADGIVYIGGQADTGLEQADIDQIVARLPGVKKVVDETSVLND